MSETETPRQAVADMHRFIVALPQADPVEKPWGPSEVVAHLVFWIESYVAQTEAILAQESFAGPQGRPKDLNAQVVEANRSQPVDALVRRLRLANERLLAYGRTLDPQVVVLGGAIPPPLPGGRYRQDRGPHPQPPSEADARELILCREGVYTHPGRSSTGWPTDPAPGSRHIG